MDDNVIPMPDARKGVASCAEVKAAMDYGYSVHTAVGDGFDEELRGKWWWCLSKPGWVDCVTDPDEHASERDAWISAIAHHKTELRLDSREQPEE